METTVFIGVFLNRWLRTFDIPFYNEAHLHPPTAVLSWTTRGYHFRWHGIIQPWFGEDINVHNITKGLECHKRETFWKCLSLLWSSLNNAPDPISKTSIFKVTLARVRRPFYYTRCLQLTTLISTLTCVLLLCLTVVANAHVVCLLADRNFYQHTTNSIVLWCIHGYCKQHYVICVMDLVAWKDVKICDNEAFGTENQAPWKKLALVEPWERIDVVSGMHEFWSTQLWAFFCRSASSIYRRFSCRLPTCKSRRILDQKYDSYDNDLLLLDVVLG